MAFIPQLLFLALSALPTHGLVTDNAWSFLPVGEQEGIAIRLARLEPETSAEPPQEARRYRLYRGLSPHFAPEKRNLVAEFTGSGEAGAGYVDPGTHLRPGVVYYYKLTVTSGAGPEESVAPAGYSLPTSHSTVVTSDALSAAAAMPFAPLKVVFIGDSITQGAGLSRTDWTPCDACAHALELGPEPRQIFYSNEGHSGHTTKDYLPGGSDFSQAIASATRLNAEHDGLLVFSIMLGTNDSASRGPNGSPIDSTTLHSNLRSIVARLLQEFPQSEVVLNRPTWYSSNTHNGATYEEEGLQRLTTYFPVLPWLAREFPRGRVFEGDTRGYDYFAATYLTTLRPEHGQNGTFYLHPNPAGARDLGCLWAQAILRATK